MTDILPKRDRTRRQAGSSTQPKPDVKRSLNADVVGIEQSWLSSSGKYISLSEC